MKFSDIDFKDCKTTWHRNPTTIKKLFSKKDDDSVYSDTIGIIHLKQYYISCWWSNNENFRAMNLLIFKRTTKPYVSSELVYEVIATTFKEFCISLDSKISYYHRLENLSSFS